MTCTFCDQPAQPEHQSCCDTHKRPQCCEHYNSAHFVWVDPCSPESHARAAVTA